MPFSAENAENGISEARVQRRKRRHFRGRPGSPYNVSDGRMIRESFDPQAMATPA